MYIYFILFQSLVYKRNSFREASRIFSRRISKVYVDLYGVFRFIWIYFEFRRIRIFWNIFRKFRKDSKLSQSLLFPSLFFYHIQNIKFTSSLYSKKEIRIFFKERVLQFHNFFEDFFFLKIFPSFPKLSTKEIPSCNKYFENESPRTRLLSHFDNPREENSLSHPREIQSFEIR